MYIVRPQGESGGDGELEEGLRRCGARARIAVGFAHNFRRLVQLRGGVTT